MKRPTRRLTASTAALTAALGSLVLSGCALRSPVQSIKPYQPSDGVVANLDTLAVRNLLVVSEGNGKPGVLSGALVNNGTTEVDVTFTPANATTPSEPVPVPPGQLVKLGNDAGAVHVQISAVAAAAGANLLMSVTTPQTGPSTLNVPVLSPTLEYATITPSATPSEPATPEASASPTTN